MDVEKTDRRKRKTEKELCRALIKLLRQKCIDEISVKELCDLTDLNRGTFYLHYKDIYDLLDKVEFSMFEEFHEIIIKYPPSEHYTLSFFEDMFNFAANNRDMYLILYGNYGDPKQADLKRKFHSTIEDKGFYKATKNYCFKSDTEREYFNVFLLSGYVGITKYWLENGMKEPVDEISKVMTYMINNLAKPYSNNN